ncbi:hypothetical protein EDB92DRAFT_1941159 [Lactarius akahatsu]|uniref:Crinkler effector protein N-terminal domain-containing protein n=1 Tax=Lactarius akahatsu TaxID=416441 RepID=A0AAD4LRH8_9AGAM|nr:hypothetical protein EDB92DRAFT_1941159 [Lactarius akahatsu]
MPTTRSAARNYELWCIIEGEDDTFPVTVPPEDTVYDLKVQVLAACDAMDPFRGLYARNLKLTKERQRLPDFSSNTNYLISSTLISAVWPTKPLQGHISVFVHLPSRTTLGKRRLAHNGSSDDFDFVRDSKVLTFAPSELGKPGKYKSLQGNSDQRILDDRPEADQVPPASLLYHGFGRFMDSFTDKGIRVESRRVNGLDALGVILGRELTAAAIGGVYFDGHYCGPHKAVTCVVEFKNELVDINSMPMIELTGYVARSRKQSSDYQSGPLFKGWNVPSLGLTVVGPYVTFYGVIFLGRSQWRLVPLTPTLSCVESACEGNDRMALYAAFSGAFSLLRHIDEDAQRYRLELPTLPHADRRFPYVSELPKYPPSAENAENEILRFRILRYLFPDTPPYRQLYIAKTLNGPEREIVVKFTRRYSIELHAFCANRERAPSILGFGQVPGGWFVVAMDYISEAVFPSHSTDLPRLRDQWTHDLRTLVDSFHEQGLVHGDLRQPNMICHGERIMLIDFDWGGRVGEASYPHARLNPQLTIGRQSVGGEITKNDDDRILQQTLQEF